MWRFVHEVHRYSSLSQPWLSPSLLHTQLGYPCLRLTHPMRNDAMAYAKWCVERESNANNHAAHAEIGSQMDREKRNPRLDGVSALLVVSFRVRRLLLSPVWACVAFLRTSKSSIRFFCASSDGGFETCGGVTATATTTSLAGTHAASSFRFRVSFTRSSSSLP